MSATMLHGGFVFLVLLTLLVWGANTMIQELEDELHEEAKLHTDLLRDYKPEYRPVRDYKNAINVKVRLALKYISFDSLEETITLHSWLAISWKDEFLTWTPSDYSDIKELQMESHLIWSPRLALFNSDASLYENDSIYTTCLVSNDGTVTCVPHLAHYGICRTTLRNWPYDTQKCSLYFGSWMHTGEQINFTFYKSRPIVLDDYQNGPGWKLLNVTNERLPGNYGLNSTYPMLKYTFKLEREAAGPAAIVVVPSVVVISLTLTSLLLDIKDNTRLILACFSLFSHFTVLTEIGYDIPKHSADTPIILLFIRDSMIVTLMAILVTLFLMYLRSRTVPTPIWIVSLNRLVSSGPGKYVVFTEFDPTNLNEERTLTEDISGSHSKDEQSRVISDWIQLANFLNSIIFIISLFVYLLLLCLYIPRDS